MAKRDQMKRRRFLAASLAAIAAPHISRAQQAGKMHRLALLAFGASSGEMTGSGPPVWRAFFEELQRLGYHEGRNLVVERRSAEGDARRLPALAREIVNLGPDAILAISNRAAAAIKAATTTLPIVALVADPVGFGFAVNLARPGGNVTGLSVDPGLHIMGKRIALLKEVVPTASRIAYLTARVFWEGRAGAYWREAARLARLTSVDAAFEYPAEEDEFRRVFAAIARNRVELLDVGPTPEIVRHRQLIVKLAAEGRLPTIYPWRESIEVGGLMAYGVDNANMLRQAAGYIDLVLKGANPAELPFQQPTKYELIINLKTAKALGLTIPESVLVQANEIIE